MLDAVGLGKGDGEGGRKAVGCCDVGGWIDGGRRGRWWCAGRELMLISLEIITPTQERVSRR